MTTSAPPTRADLVVDAGVRRRRLGDRTLVVLVTTGIGMTTVFGLAPHILDRFLS